MKKKTLFLVLPLLVLAACSSSSPSEKSESMINDFENLNQLALMKFPNPTHSNRGRFELSEEHVTSGNKSVRFENYYGTVFEMQHFFSNTAEGSLDVTTIRSLELDIYNDSDFDTSCIFRIYMNSTLDTLLSQPFDLPRKQATHISFPLSKIALDYNSSNIVSSSLTLYTPNTDYNNNVGYVFYMDAWKAILGSTMTEEDEIYSEKINTVRDEIAALPDSEDIKLTDHDALYQIAKDYGSLPDLYRRIVPNYTVYKACVDTYFQVAKNSYQADGGRDPFFSFNEFYGISELVPQTSGVELVYAESRETPCTKVCFMGATDNRFSYQPFIEDTSTYDYVNFDFYNDTENTVRVWFNYSEMIYVDIAPGNSSSVTYKVSEFKMSQDYWAIHQFTQGSGTILPASGTLYLYESYLTGKSPETQKDNLLYCLDRLPSVEEFTGEDNILSALTTIRSARKIYNQLSATAQATIDADKLALLSSLETLADASGYSVALNIYEKGMSPFAYGENFAGTFGDRDDRFGFVATAPIDSAAQEEYTNVHEQSFITSASPDLTSGATSFIQYVYNPTQFELNYLVRCSDWNWADNEHLFVKGTLAPGWNKIVVSRALYEVSEDRCVVFYVNDGGENHTLHGDWLFSSVFGSAN